jgi:hypothetical protein
MKDPSPEVDASSTDLAALWILILFAASLAIARYLVLYFEIDYRRSDADAFAFSGGALLALVSLAMMIVRMVASKERAASLSPLALVFWLISALFAWRGCVLLPSVAASFIADCAIVSFAYLIIVSVRGFLVVVPLDVLLYKASATWRRLTGRGSDAR